MDGFNTIQHLWQEQPVAQVPTAPEILAAMKKFRRREKNNLYLSLLLLLLAFMAMLAATVFYHSALFTTRLGELLIMVVVLYGAYLKIKTFRKAGKTPVLDASHFLEQLKQDHLHTCTGSVNEQATAFSLLSVAYFFYLYEAISGNTTTLIAGYAIAAVVLGCMWFLYRPYMVRRRQRKIRSLIDKIETIKKEAL